MISNLQRAVCNRNASSFVFLAIGDRSQSQNFHGSRQNGLFQYRLTMMGHIGARCVANVAISVVHVVASLVLSVFSLSGRRRTDGSDPATRFCVFPERAGLHTGICLSLRTERLVGSVRRGRPVINHTRRHRDDSRRSASGVGVDRESCASRLRWRGVTDE